MFLGVSKETSDMKCVNKMTPALVSTIDLHFALVINLHLESY